MWPLTRCTCAAACCRIAGERRSRHATTCENPSSTDAFSALRCGYRSGDLLLDLSATIPRSGKVVLVSTDEQDPTDRETRAMLLSEISNAMTGVYKEFFGRGPTMTRTYWSGPNALTTFLEDTLTPAERNMVKLGEHQRLRDTRMFFQYATVTEFCEPVERITGRKVRAFLSSIDTEVDGLSIETFVLHPEGYDGPSRIAASRS